MSMEIKKGDAYPIWISMTDSAGEPITDEMVQIVEVCIGKLRKTYPGEITYENGTFFFPLTQEESFAMCKEAPSQVRVKLATGEVVGQDMDLIDVSDSLSKEVL